MILLDRHLTRVVDRHVERTEATSAPGSRVRRLVQRCGEPGVETRPVERAS